MTAPIPQLDAKGNIDGLIILLRDKDPSVGDSAIQALAEIGGPAVDPLIEAIHKNAENYAYTEMLCRALRAIGAPSVEPLIRAIKGEEGFRTRYQMVMLLGEIRDKRALEALLEELRFHKPLAEADPVLSRYRYRDAHVREAAARGLGLLRETRAVGPLIEALSDEDASVAYEAAEALIQIGQPAVDPLLAAVRGLGKASSARAEAAHALAGLKDSRAIPVLLPWLNDSDPNIVKKTTEALTALGWKKSGAPAETFSYLASESSRLRQVALAAAIVVFAAIIVYVATSAATTPIATSAPTTAAGAASPTREAAVLPTVPATLAITPLVPTRAPTTPPTLAIATLAPAPTATSIPTDVPGSSLKIGVVTDVGQIDDRSFNQMAWEGASAAARELGGIAKYIVTRDPYDYANNIATFADNGYTIIVTVGFALGDATLKAAARYPDVTFIGVDQFQDTPVKNVTALVFHQDQAGFLAGMLAARLSRSGVIAAVLGTDYVPPVVAYKEGYEAGAKYARPDIKVISTYYPGGIDRAFTDPVWGAQTAGQAVDQGADVVFGVGGKTGNGALSELARRTTQTKPLYCIGVDVDQWLTVPEAHPCLVSSAMNLIDSGVADLIRQAAAGTIQGGNFYGDVGLAPFYDFERVVPEAVKKEIAQAQADLKQGTLSAR